MYTHQINKSKILIAIIEKHVLLAHFMSMSMFCAWYFCVFMILLSFISVSNTRRIKNKTAQWWFLMTTELQLNSSTKIIRLVPVKSWTRWSGKIHWTISQSHLYKWSQQSIDNLLKVIQIWNVYWWDEYIQRGTNQHLARVFPLSHSDWADLTNSVKNTSHFISCDVAQNA